MSAPWLVLKRGPRGWLAHAETARPHLLCGPSEGASRTELLEFAIASAIELGCPARHCVLVDSGKGLSAPASDSHAGVPLLLTKTSAVAHLLADTAGRFAVVDLREQPAIARLVFRHGGELVEEALVDANPARVGDALRLLQIRHAVICADENQAIAAAPAYVRALGCDITAEIVTSDESHIRGAVLALRQRRDDAGVHEVGPEHLQIVVPREIRYDLYRPANPVFSAEETVLRDVAKGNPIFFVIDSSIEALYGETLRRYGRQHLVVAGEFVCDAAESRKTVAMVEEICRSAYHCGLGRDGIIVAVGGGVTLDLAGFAASVYRRGVSYVRVPTTLIGLVDVSVGVKQACNAFGAKNFLGSFYPPVAGILDYSFLQTLPQPALSAGFAEILKMAIIRDESLLTQIERHGRALIDSAFRAPAETGRRIAARAELLMAQELAPNLFENTLTRHVDFGHTFSPVIETHSQYRISHGEAVALDMLLSTAIAVNRRLCDPALLSRLLRLVSKLRLPCWHPEMPDTADLMESLAAARRHRGGALNLVVPLRAGAVTFLQEVSVLEIETAALDLERASAWDEVDANSRLRHSTPTAQEGHSHASLGV